MKKEARTNRKIILNLYLAREEDAKVMINKEISQVIDTTTIIMQPITMKRTKTAMATTINTTMDTTITINMCTTLNSTMTEWTWSLMTTA